MEEKCRSKHWIKNIIPCGLVFPAHIFSCFLLDRCLYQFILDISVHNHQFVINYSALFICMFSSSLMSGFQHKYSGEFDQHFKVIWLRERKNINVQ